MRLRFAGYLLFLLAVGGVLVADVVPKLRPETDLLALLHRWQHQGKTVIVVLHDLAQVRAHFPLTLLLARELVASGPTAEVLSDAHWARAQRMQEPFDDDAPLCAATPDPHTHVHNHAAEALA